VSDCDFGHSQWQLLRIGLAAGVFEASAVANRATKSGWRMMTLLVQFLGYRHEGS
jgi:hypothetical protein